MTSDEIYDFEPDAVIVTHEYTPKLTKFLTIGVVWSPLAFFSKDPARIRNILSYDGYLVATQSLRDFIDDLLSSHGKEAPVSSFDFLPTAMSERSQVPLRLNPTIFYAGVHWDGGHHDDLFSELYGRLPLSVYGNPTKWGFVGEDYKGTIPFDGRSVVDEIARCGVALSLHSTAHRTESIPSMRLFEAASAGAIIISDSIDFAKQEFGDSLLYIDSSLGASAGAKQISAHMAWIRSNPEAARSLAASANAIFRRRFSLEAQLKLLPDFVESVRNSMMQSDEGIHGLVEVIVRLGSRPTEMVRRALLSIASQSYPRIALVLVCYRSVHGLEDLLDEFDGRFERITRVDVPDNGLRSTALWAGLKAAKADYVCNLDDDDTIHPTHIASQVSSLVRHPDAQLVYSGVIECQEEPGHWFDEINFTGDIGRPIEESRRLRFLEPFSRDRMLQFDNFIQSNCWMVRRGALTDDILVDPETRVAEDILLYLLLMKNGDFVPTWRVTADWNWRSASRDNSMFASEQWADIGLVIARLEQAGIKLPSLPAENQDLPTRVAQPRLTQTLKRIVRKPSILLGPLAPHWRRQKARWRGDRSQR